MNITLEKAKKEYLSNPNYSQKQKEIANDVAYDYRYFHNINSCEHCLVYGKYILWVNNRSDLKFELWEFIEKILKKEGDISGNKIINCQCN